MGMDKRRAWREQEQDLVGRWNSAVERDRAARLELSRQAELGESVSAELQQRAASARADMEAVRREVARLKVQFYSGKRY
jgi:hypothetical protein